MLSPFPSWEYVPDYGVIVGVGAEYLHTKTFGYHEAPNSKIENLDACH